MRSSEASRPPTRARALVAAIAVVVAALAYGDARSTSAGPGGGGRAGASPAARLKAEYRFARAQLPARLQAALGDAFGGVWFDRGTAQLRVGVTSGASRHAAEALAARLGLADILAETPVRSTWAQLVAAQQRWNRLLDDLFARTEVSTAPSARKNAVEVELGSAVPQSRRAPLEREAASDDVEVSFEIAPAPEIRILPQARCTEFVPSKQYCDPTIVAGTSLINEKDQDDCTVGPAVVLKDRSKPADATKTYVLTAGHCILSRGIGAKWYSKDKAGKNKGLIGAGIQGINSKVDVGVVEVENPGFWAAKGFIPVSPESALWEEGKESETSPVTGEAFPTEESETCISGEMSGYKCGIITKVTHKVGMTENLAEVEGASTLGGDSGGPWSTKAFPSIIEGTHKGVNVGNGHSDFQELRASFPELKKYELLTFENESRHAFKIAAEAAPVVLTGKRSGGSEDVFKADAGTLSCNGVSYNGELPEAETIEMSVTPTYSECKVGSTSATVDVNGCKYTFRPLAKEGSSFEGSADLVCPEGKKLTITGLGCTITVGSQSGLQKVTFTNTGSGSGRELIMDLSLTGLAYEEHPQGFIPSCTNKTVPTSSGTYTTGAAIRAETAAGSPRGLWVE
jgi:hypothetical protein